MDLKAYFSANPEAAVAFSGGVDSAYLLYAAARYGKRIKAYYVKTPFQPDFEWEDAKTLARQLNVPMQTIAVDVLCQNDIAQNPKNRCYFCKKTLFSQILEGAARDGFSLVVDGTNASDAEGDRPGMQALRELQVHSPLRLCGLSKADIRRASREAGLFTYDKPAYACLATRIPTGEPITREKLEITERAEGFLWSLGLRDFRVRMENGMGKIQVRQQDLPLVMQHRQRIVEELKPLYHSVLLDLEVRNAI